MSDDDLLRLMQKNAARLACLRKRLDELDEAIRSMLNPDDELRNVNECALKVLSQSGSECWGCAVPELETRSLVRRTTCVTESIYSLN